MIEENGVDFGSQKDGQDHTGQELGTSPPIGNGNIKDGRIKDPHNVGVPTGCLDEPFGASVKKWIVGESEIDRVLDEESGAFGIQRTCAVFYFYSGTHHQKEDLEGSNNIIQNHFESVFVVSFLLVGVVIELVLGCVIVGGIKFRGSKFVASKIFFFSLHDVIMTS